MIEYNPDADYIFNAVIEEQGYSPETLFDGIKLYLGQTLIVFNDNSIYLSRVAQDEDIKAAKFVAYIGKKYQIAPNQFSVSPILPKDIAEVIAASEYSGYLEEITIG